MAIKTKNLYEILGVKPWATQSEIKIAYKKLVRVYHPDINKSNDAEINFKLLNNAYRVLLNDEQRKNYDSLLDISNKTKKEERPQKGSIIKTVKITEIEQKSGTTRIVNILNTQKCPKCLGEKVLRGVRCAFCKGEGEKKSFKKIEVKIKPNIQNGETVYVGKINASALYDKNLFLKIYVEPACKIIFEEGSAVVELNVPFYDAILGCEREINIPHFGLYRVIIPEASKEGDKIKLEIEEKIDFYAKVKIIMPKEITSEEKKLFQKLKKIIEPEEKCEFEE